jgi:hypothetical protein
MGGRALQQWWRQLRSYIHQQRSWRRRMGKAAGLEGEQGEAGGGVTQVAATPPPRTGGGANGLGSSRASGWRRWRKVLLLLLVWMVVPVEATVAAGAAGGAVTAVATAAAAANMALNYWALVEDDTAGDLKVLSKGAGVVRIMSTNLRRVKRDETGLDMSKVVWEETMRAVEDAAVDIWAAQDTGVEDGSTGSAVECWET